MACMRLKWGGSIFFLCQPVSLLSQKECGELSPAQSTRRAEKCKLKNDLMAPNIDQRGVGWGEIGLPL